MKIYASRESFTKVDKTLLRSLGIDIGSGRSFSMVSIDMRRYGQDKAALLFDLIPKLGFEPKEEKKHIAAVKRWLDILDGKSPRAANARSGYELVKTAIAMSPSNIVYANHEGRVFAFYVSSIQYHEEHKDHPAYFIVSLDYMAHGSRHKCCYQWDGGVCRGKTAEQILAKHGLLLQTPELLAEYDESIEVFREIVTRIGLQCYCTGVGYYEHRYHRSDSTGLKEVGIRNPFKKCDLFGEPTVVVVDVIDDDDDEPSVIDLEDQMTSNCSLDEIRALVTSKDPIDPEYLPAAEDAVEGTRSEAVPMHPILPVFDMKRNGRYVVHAMDLKPYVYDDSLFDKLILPNEFKRLLGCLSSSTGNEFRDIVGGKSGGTTVLLAGRPGLGKTLSAEVFSEITHRPLYRVQCSDLGIDPDDIEAKLKQVLARARRWSAIVLLDEADIYIARRGDDLARNAIVCTFLRVLETSEATLFLTTNLPETVDDAIASRCIARIDMTHPGPEALKRIWQVLLSSSGAVISEDDIDRLVAKYDRMGGRDVKAAIKLAMVGKSEIGFDSLDFTLQFHPNKGDWKIDR